MDEPSRLLVDSRSPDYAQVGSNTYASSASNNANRLLRCRRTLLTSPQSPHQNSRYTDSTVRSVRAVRCLRAVAHLGCWGWQVFESWKKPSTASTLLIRWSAVRIRHDLPPISLAGSLQQPGGVQIHGCVRCRRLAMFEANGLFCIAIVGGVLAPWHRERVRALAFRFSGGLADRIRLLGCR